MVEQGAGHTWLSGFAFGDAVEDFLEKSSGGNIILVCDEDEKLVELLLSLPKEKRPFVTVAFVEVCDLNHHLRT